MVAAIHGPRPGRGMGMGNGMGNASPAKKKGFSRHARTNRSGTLPQPTVCPALTAAAAVSCPAHDDSEQ